MGPLLILTSSPEEPPIPPWTAPDYPASNAVEKSVPRRAEKSAPKMAIYKNKNNNNLVNLVFKPSAPPLSLKPSAKSAHTIKKIKVAE